MKLLLTPVALLLSILSFAQDICPPVVGDELTEAEIISIDSDTTTLKEAIGKDKTVLIFFRGGWCPYCKKHLSAIGKAEEDIIDLGYKIVAVSTDDVAHSKEAIEKLNISYTLYSDNQMAAADSLGISFTVDDKTLKRYNTFGLDLEGASGKTHHKLPVPTILIVEKGKIVFTYINPNYKERLDAETLLALLKTL